MPRPWAVPSSVPRVLVVILLSASPGAAVVAQPAGALDEGGVADVAMVIRERDAARIAHHPAGVAAACFVTRPRALPVLLARGPDEFQLAATGRTLIQRGDDPAMDDPSDPDRWIATLRGTPRTQPGVVADPGGWELRRSLAGRQMVLVGFDRDTVTRNTGESERMGVNRLSGWVERTSGRPYPVTVGAV